MTLDEAIKHAEEVADKKEREKQKWDEWLEHDSDYRATAEKESCELCATEHRQLAEWLKELKKLREQTDVTDNNVGDLISRHAVESALYNLGLGDEENGGVEYKCALADVKAELKNIPSVDPERKPGHWEWDRRTGEYVCSECGCNPIYERTTPDVSEIDKYRYCRWCGAPMEVKT